MRRKAESDREAIVDEAIDRYVCWREACASVQESYEAWCSVGRDEREKAYAAHVASLDREATAAARYEQTLAQVDVLAPHARNAASVPA